MNDFFQGWKRKLQWKTNELTNGLGTAADKITIVGLDFQLFLSF